MPRFPLLALVAVAAVALLGAVRLARWLVYQRRDALAEVSLADAVTSASILAPASAAEQAVTRAAASPGNGGEVAQPSTDAMKERDLAGKWVVDPRASFVGYRVDEELRGIGATTAVGRTSAVEGTLEFDGTAITSVAAVCDLRQMQSDDARRHGQLRTHALETDRFPEATFMLVEPIVIEGDPASGRPISAQAVGDLTLHGVTRRVSLAVEGQLVEGAVVVVGSAVIALADYDIDQPSTLNVLSVSEVATIEMQLVFRRP
jgi:polyisoprenoid-binding protein YceI